MMVKIFSLNKYKSDMLKQNNIQHVKMPPSWALRSNGFQVNGSSISNGYASCNDWNAYVDEKYVRR